MKYWYIVTHSPTKLAIRYASGISFFAIFEYYKSRDELITFAYEISREDYLKFLGKYMPNSERAIG